MDTPDEEKRQRDTEEVIQEATSRPANRFADDHAWLVLVTGRHVSPHAHPGAPGRDVIGQAQTGTGKIQWCISDWTFPAGSQCLTVAHDDAPKVRELIADLKAAGFVDRGGKGSHRNFVHPKVPTPVTISGPLGYDAKHYQIRAVRLAIEESRR